MSCRGHWKFKIIRLAETFRHFQQKRCNPLAGIHAKPQCTLLGALKFLISRC
jgi:hypothetical protein